VLVDVSGNGENEDGKCTIWSVPFKALGLTLRY